MKIIATFALLCAAVTATTTFAQEVKYSAASRQFHEGEGALDLPLPGVESRQAAGSNYQIVVSLNEAVLDVGEAKIDGAVKESSVTKTGVEEFVVDLVGVVNAQRINVYVPVTTTSGEYTVPVSMDILFGDVNGDGVVNAGDALLSSKHSVTIASSATYRADVDGSGAIDKNDVALIRANSGTALPAAK
jgi:hypothetical protein